MEGRGQVSIISHKRVTSSDLEVRKAGFSSECPYSFCNWLQPTKQAFMYKVNHGMVPSNANDIFSVQSSKYHLRNKDSNIPKFNTVHYRKHCLDHISSKAGYPRR